MRISEKIANGKRSIHFCSSGTIKNSADRRIAASATNGTQQISIVSPGGMVYIPQQNDEAVVISNDAEQLCVGVKVINNYYDIDPGEIVLFSAGGASVHLTNEGKVLIEGDVYINGVKSEG